MSAVTRRVLGAGIAMLVMLSLSPASAEDLKELRIGFQKTNLPVIAQQQKVIEKTLEPKGTTVKWVHRLSKRSM